MQIVALARRDGQTKFAGNSLLMPADWRDRALIYEDGLLIEARERLNGYFEGIHNFHCDAPEDDLSRSAWAIASFMRCMMGMHMMGATVTDGDS